MVMIMKRIDNVDIKVLNGEMDDREIKNYIQYVKEKYKDET